MGDVIGGPSHFMSKLTDADAEQAAQHGLDTALACVYVSKQQHKTLLNKCQRIGRMLGTMMAKPETFCSKSGG